MTQVPLPLVGLPDAAAARTVLVDDEAVPIGQVAWVMIAPCGCTEGILWAGRPGDHDPVLTLEQASKKFCRSATERRREEKLGFVVTAAKAGSDMVDASATRCTHTPLWGVPLVDAPAPDGWTWASLISNPAGTRHLVPSHDARTLQARREVLTSRCQKQRQVAGAWLVDPDPPSQLHPFCSQCRASAKTPETRRH